MLSERSQSNNQQFRTSTPGQSELFSEGFGLHWIGKKETQQLVDHSSTHSLKRISGIGIDEERTNNLFIEGDNLKVLQTLQETYHEQIDLIYIDPPYNTGKNFIYDDNFEETMKRYLQRCGITNDNQRCKHTHMSGRIHTNWLNMMYSRLLLAYKMLASDGVIVIHIDEKEESNLELLLFEIFGEENRIGKLIWDKRNPKGDASKVAYQHEVIYVFAKKITNYRNRVVLKRTKENVEQVLNKAKRLYAQIGKTMIPEDLKQLAKKYNLPKELLDKHKRIVDMSIVNELFQQWLNRQVEFSEGLKAYKYIDEYGKVYRPVSMAWPNKKKAPDQYFVPLIHPITGRTCAIPKRGWRNPPETMKRLLDEQQILFGCDEKTIPNRKYYLEEHMLENIPSILRYGASDDAFFAKIGLSFDNPKPYPFSKQLIQYFTHSDALVMDFFAGSGTTAHAVYEANKGDNGTRKYILVERQEAIKGQKYASIASLAQERIRRSIELLNESDQNEEQQDRGFKVYQLE
ncbi:site-specific DNA-methyltransferase [Bacillus solimangrovi]|uniref:DNA methylase N-4/N-6 domain-containing protein n=1 Tax=Bacillus solimangrovi TaxID=1305675 RepID=A0A1E5LHN6_9BACI|nr:site-specific DNA-methyltransferase [Bacillus solimangrovi]OEH93604.1 hypothetical protein BFG57_01055 [Bacillus solimangrovi]